MVLLWSALASRKVNLLTHSIKEMPAPPSGCAWITYIRCHDDIGWAVTDENAAEMGESGPGHRAFLSDFYSGRFPGTFARGKTFQFNPKTDDRRISGTLASLAGLQVAIGEIGGFAITQAIDRILLLHNLIFAFGGIPVIYMGDELGMLNDESYLEEPDLAGDNRWMHRPYMDWETAEKRHDPNTFVGKIYQGLLHLIAARRRTLPLHAEAQATAVWTHNEHVFGLIRTSPRGKLLILANVTENDQSVPVYRLGELGFSSPLVDHVSQETINASENLQLKPYQTMWLEQT
jgi:amylosucrase